MSDELLSLKNKILEVLRQFKSPVSSELLRQQLNVDIVLLSKVLFEMYREGIIDRIYTEDYDPTRPFDTVSWRIKSEKAKLKGIEHERSVDISVQNFRLVLSIPMSLHMERAELLNKYNAIDFFDAYTHVINLAENELKMVCPIIDAYGIFPIINRLTRTSSLKVRILTELDKSKDLEYVTDIVKPSRLLIADASSVIETKKGFMRKIRGVHMKMIVADNKVALVGSFNFSKYHYMVNFDIGFLIYDLPVIELLSNVFEGVWEYISSS